jgi:hypothetical protein
MVHPPRLRHPVGGGAGGGGRQGGEEGANAPVSACGARVRHHHCLWGGLGAPIRRHSMRRSRSGRRSTIWSRRVAQEALTNARKHAHTTRVRMRLERAGREVHLVVEDEGRGFVPEAIMPGTGDGERVGLPGMRERVAMLGGHCVVESHPGAGTRVSVAVPLEVSDTEGTADDR